MFKCIKCQKEVFSKFAKEYCSQSCSSLGNQNNLKHGKYVKKNCAVCEKSTTNSKFCSPGCYAVSISRPKKYFTEEEKLHAKRMRGREATARYSAKKRNQTPEWADLDAIKLFYLNCPPGHEIDHIIPISKGGLHSLENLQYLTISENRKKWCKIMEPPERFELS